MGAEGKVLIILQIRTVKSSSFKVAKRSPQTNELDRLILRTFSLLEATMNKKTKALTTEQYKEIIATMKEGFCGCRPNERIATALVLEGNLGLRISDILKLRLCDIVLDGDRYRLEIVEQKTGKSRVFTVPLVIQQYIENYCLRNGIRRDELMFPLTERAIQKQLKIVCDYLGFEGISTHSFRKWYATEIYKNNGYDIALVQRLLQHSSAATTQRYIGIEPQRIEAAIQGHATLL
jgi:integrase